MRPFLSETEQIERYLGGQLPPEEHAAFRVRLLTDPAWEERVEQQRATYELVRTYGRRRLRCELDAIHQRLMARPSFRRRILAIFGK